MKIKLLLVMIFIIAIITNCSNNQTVPIKEYIYIPVKDTIGERDNLNKIIELQHELNLTRDSLRLIKDSLSPDLFVANYKLARIKEYNRIAGQGNNIKFLRGWINRVLNDD